MKSLPQTLRFPASEVMRKESQDSPGETWGVHGREAPPCDLCVKTDEEADSQQPILP